MISTLYRNMCFELGIRKKQLSTYVYFLMFFSLGLLLALAAGGVFKGAQVTFGLSNKVLINSPVALNLFISSAATFGLFLIAPIFGQSIYRDYGAQFEQIVFSTSAHRAGLLLGRFLGALITLLFIFSSIGLGLWVGTLFPGVQESVLGPNSFLAYFLPYLTSILPNTFIFGAIFFLLASKTKNMPAVYIAGILLFMGWMISGQLTSDLDNKLLTSLIDPFGLNAVSELTKYWSVSDQNTKYILFDGYYLYNRILWGFLGVSCFLYSILSFSPQQKTSRKADKISKKQNAVSILEDITMPSITPSTDCAAKFTMFKRQLRFEISQIFGSIYFRSIALAGVLYVFIASSQIGKMFGTTTYPVTYKVLDILGATFNLFILIILTFYAGEAIWRDRNNRVDQVLDSYPAPNWVYLGAKFLSLQVVTLALLSILMVCGILIQTFNGYTHYELGLYMQELFILKFISFFNISALAFLFQVLLNNKYIGHGAMIFYYILSAWLPSLGLEHKLYLFNAAPTPIYSDMNQYGRFLHSFFSFKFYWLSLAIVLLVLSSLFWQRGVLTDRVDRFNELRRRWNLNHLIVLSLSLILFSVFGSYIYYNTNIKNIYRTTKSQEALQFQYEKKFKSYDKAPFPHITSVQAFVDIFPYQAKMKARLVHKLKNNTQAPIKELFLNFPSVQYNSKIKLDRQTQEKLIAKELDVSILEFTDPLMPGQEFQLEYTVEVDNSHFPNSRPDRKIVKNGTFVSSFNKYFLKIGYQPNFELSSTKTRRKYGLKAKKRVPELKNKEAHYHNYISKNAHWIDFEAIVSTAEDQIAIAPGYLIKEWKEKNRKYFHYKMDQKILNFYSFLSGKYKVKKDKWKNVNIEIYYHHTHDKNLDRMIDATKMSLDYFTKNFSPYQHKQFRIIEFPRYSAFAQSFPNTIPFSESVGFIAKVDENDPKDIDYPFYITAHELAHQWWGHQVIGAGVQGATMMSETFSQYSALRVMEKKYGKSKMKKFLKYELDRYLSGRGLEHEKELPLYKNENQGYIHYRKGSLVMYSLQDSVGEDVVNNALSKYIKKVAYQSAPYTTSIEFLDILKSNIDPKDITFVDEIFKKIVLYQNRPIKAEYTKLDKGKYRVDLQLSVKKINSNESGKEIEVPLNDFIYVGVEDKNGTFLYLKKHKLINGDNNIIIEVDREPYKAGVDPLNMLVDKNPDDNQMRVLENTAS